MQKISAYTNSQNRAICHLNCIRTVANQSHLGNAFVTWMWLWHQSSVSPWHIHQDFWAGSGVLIDRETRNISSVFLVYGMTVERETLFCRFSEQMQELDWERKVVMNLFPLCLHSLQFDTFVGSDYKMMLTQKNSIFDPITVPRSTKSNCRQWRI